LADQLLREAREPEVEGDNPGMWQLRKANTRGWQAVNLLMREQSAEAEPLAREAVAIFDRQQGDVQRRFYWVSVLGAVLSGQERYAEAEPLLLEGYEGMKQRESVTRANERRRIAEAGERLVRFYETTGQPEQASAWREKLKATGQRVALDGAK
jgi:hypothetical protein